MSEQELPPGQRPIDKMIQYARFGIPKVDANAWKLKVHGEVNNPIELKLEDLEHMRVVEIVGGLHCVEGWSVKGIRWAGVPLNDIVDLADPKPSATHAFFRCLDGYSTVTSLDEIKSRSAVLATRMNGQILTLETGYPVRLVIPGVYAWKYAKWVSEVEILDHYEAGYWESRGYHPRGDIWKEERRV